MSTPITSVLFVDDEQDILRLTKIFMEKTGEFRVDTISSAEEALNLSHIQSYDVIVSDYQMPGMDGITFLKTVREKYGDIPFILFMGEGCEEILIEAINNGADFYLKKGGSPQSLFTELAYGIRQAVKRKNIEKELQESEEKFRSFVEYANEIVYSMTPKGIYTYISPKATELLGYEIHEAVGKSSELFIHPDDYPRLHELFIQVLTTGKSISGNEYRIKHKDGSWRWHMYSLSAIHDNEGNVVRFQGISYDISERKQAEEAIRKANRQLSLLYGITRHDILNRITVILGYLDIAETDHTDSDLSDYLLQMKMATKEIQSQIEFTRVYEELGSHEPQWIPLDAVMPYSSVPASITLTADIRDICVFGDPMLEKVFFNLLDNSIRHGQRVTDIRVSARESEGNLMIVWEDNGIGIPAEEKEQIFERGFGKNTGLGMFLVREILSLTDITITESGIQGRGVRFGIIVPKGMYRLK